MVVNRLALRCAYGVGEKISRRTKMLPGNGSLTITPNNLLLIGWGFFSRGRSVAFSNNEALIFVSSYGPVL